MGALQIINFRHAQAVLAYFRTVKQPFFRQLGRAYITAFPGAPGARG